MRLKLPYFSLKSSFESNDLFPVSRASPPNTSSPERFQVAHLFARSNKSPYSVSDPDTQFAPVFKSTQREDFKTDDSSDRSDLAEPQGFGDDFDGFDSQSHDEDVAPLQESRDLFYTELRPQYNLPL